MRDSDETGLDLRVSAGSDSPGSLYLIRTTASSENTLAHCSGRDTTPRIPRWTSGPVREHLDLACSRP